MMSSFVNENGLVCLLDGNFSVVRVTILLKEDLKSKNLRVMMIVNEVNHLGGWNSYPHNWNSHSILLLLFTLTRMRYKSNKIIEWGGVWISLPIIYC